MTTMTSRVKAAVADLEIPVTTVQRFDRVVKHGQTPEAALREYKDDLVAQVEPLVKLLEDSPPKSILDIGCGLAGVTAVLAKWFDAPVVHLLDGDPSDLGDRRGGFKPAGKPWFSVAGGAEIVKHHAPDAQVITHYEGEWIDDRDIDLVLSLKSWCFHYPADVYMRQVERSLAVGGHLVVDARRGSGVIKDLRRLNLSVVSMEDVNQKRARVVYRRGDRVLA